MRLPAAVLCQKIVHPNKTQCQIRILSPVLIDKIAAGEVIEGPSSVIKELLENALDAKANSIRIETQEAGLEQITIEDDGEGIYIDDLKASVVRHATSKISLLEDLEKLRTLGFRGEALASIASISHLQIKSRRQDQETGGEIICRGGEIIHEAKANHTKGTTVRAGSLFYSTPARRKYLKSVRAENAKNNKEITKAALSNSQVHFDYYREGKVFASYPAKQSLQERITAVYGKQLSENLLEFQEEHSFIKISGCISSPEYSRANRDGQYSFVNQRPAEIKNISFIIRKAYDELLSPGMHPYFFLFLEIEPSRIDINVHPQKKEIRLLDQSLLQGVIYNTISRALRPRRPLSIGEIQGSQAEYKNRTKMDFSTGKLPLGRTLHLSPGSILDFASEKSTVTPHKEKTDSLPQKNFDSAFTFRRHFGTVLGTYIIAEGDGRIYIIDQHTAHERVNYEQTLNKLESIQSQRQGLLKPLLVECLPDELEGILAHRVNLEKNGFLIEAAGPKSYVVREIPPYLDPGTELDVLVHLIHGVMEGRTNLHLYKDYAAMRACKASIKKNDCVSDEILSDILTALPKCKEPGRCPHGRPTLIQISRQDLDRMFQR